ncbi:hypothetical protein [Bacillus phage SPO1L1]|nr:hypothetical protein [Bacillus phage SPO1L1]WIT26140.1 hypothetical protein [Bacillus phage SPO1L2]
MATKHTIKGKSGNLLDLIPGHVYEIECWGTTAKAEFVALGSNSVGQSYCFYLNEGVNCDWGTAEYSFIGVDETERVIGLVQTA